MFDTRPLLTVTAYAVDGPPYIRCRPQLQEVKSREPTLTDRMDCVNTITQQFANIIAGCKLIPRVEKILFPGETHVFYVLGNSDFRLM